MRDCSTLWPWGAWCFASPHQNNPALGHAILIALRSAQSIGDFYASQTCFLQSALGQSHFATPASLRSAFADEVASIVIVSQHGLPYLPLMVMDTLKLVEKHAVKAGIFSLKPEYKTLGGTQSLIDALLSGQMHFGVTGVPGLATLWDKTAGTANEVRALSAVQSMPFMLVTNREVDQNDQGLHRIRTRSRCRRSKNLKPSDLPADGSRQGVGAGSIR